MLYLFFAHAQMFIHHLSSIEISIVLSLLTLIRLHLCGIFGRNSFEHHIVTVNCFQYLKVVNLFKGGPKNVWLNISNSLPCKTFLSSKGRSQNHYKKVVSVHLWSLSRDASASQWVKHASQTRISNRTFFQSFLTLICQRSRSNINSQRRLLKQTIEGQCWNQCAWIAVRDKDIIENIELILLSRNWNELNQLIDYQLIFQLENFKM